MRKIISEDKYGWPVEITEELTEQAVVLDEGAGAIKSLAGLLKALEAAGLDAEVISVEERVSYSAQKPFQMFSRDSRRKSVTRKKLKVGDNFYRLDELGRLATCRSSYGSSSWQKPWDDLLKKILSDAGKQAPEPKEDQETQLDEAVKFVGTFPKKVKDAAKKAEEKHPGSIESIEDEEQPHDSATPTYWLYLNKHTVDNDGQHTYSSDDIETLLSDIQGIRPCGCEECKPVEKKIDEVNAGSRRREWIDHVVDADSYLERAMRIGREMDELIDRQNKSQTPNRTLDSYLKRMKEAQAAWLDRARESKDLADQIFSALDKDTQNKWEQFLSSIKAVKTKDPLDEMATSRSTLKKYQVLLDKPVWDKQEILGVAHQLSALHRGHKRDSMDEEFKYILHDLLSYFEDEGKRKDISADQTAQGISWLSKTVLNKQGEMRNTAVVKNAGFTQEHADIIKDFKKFELVGFKDIGNHTYAPQYAVISNAGKEFVYHVSGGWGGSSIEVV